MVGLKLSLLASHLSTAFDAAVLEGDPNYFGSRKRKKKDIVVGINTFHWLSRVQILPLSLILASDLAFLNFRGLFT